MARLRGETAQPKALAELVELQGPTKTAKDLGVSTTLLHHARRKNEVTKSVELAAQAILHELCNRPAPVAHAPKAAETLDSQVMVMVRAPEKAVEPIKRMVEWMGGTAMVLET